MATPKSAPAPVLERYYTVAEAAVRLNLRPERKDTEEEESKKGEKWLRDGVNRPEDGSKGPKFPCHRMAGKLMFSDSDLAVIAEHSRNTPERRGRRRRTRLGSR